jgi:hypothetical protein
VYAGEVCDYLKKTHGHGKPLDRNKLGALLGRMVVAIAAFADGINDGGLERVLDANIAKLRARYPAGFTVAAAEAKADEKRAGFAPAGSHSDNAHDRMLEVTCDVVGCGLSAEFYGDDRWDLSREAGWQVDRRTNGGTIVKCPDHRKSGAV